MTDYFYQKSYPSTVRITLIQNGSALNLSGKTVTVKIEKPSETVVSFTTSDSELSIYDAANGIIDLSSTDATLWNEVGNYRIQSKVDNLYSDILTITIKDIIE